MLAFITEATIRSSALIASVWVLLKACKMREPSGEKLAWTLVMAASLAMPMLTSLTVANAIPLQIVPWRLTVSMDRIADLPLETHLLGSALLTVYFLGAATFAARAAARYRGIFPRGGQPDGYATDLARAHPRTAGAPRANGTDVDRAQSTAL